MKALIENLISGHVICVDKMTRAYLSRFVYKISFTTLLHKIIIVYTFRLALLWSLIVRFHSLFALFDMSECKVQPGHLNCFNDTKHWTEITSGMFMTNVLVDTFGAKIGVDSNYL